MLLAGTVLFVAMAAVLVAGVWGLLSSPTTLAAPARIGEAVSAPGGIVRVDGVTPESMAPMQEKKFSSSGMVMDRAPAGRRRFTVGVTLAAAQDDELTYSEKAFRLSGESMQEAGPIRHQLEAGTIAPGGSVSGSLTFQAPEEARDLVLSFENGRPISLDLEPTGSSGNPPGGAPEDAHDH